MLNITSLAIQVLFILIREYFFSGNVDKGSVCALELDDGKVKQFQDAIKNFYWQELFIGIVDVYDSAMFALRESAWIPVSISLSFLHPFLLQL